MEKTITPDIKLVKPSEPLFPTPAPKPDKPKEPRKQKEIEHDFRMAKFTGKIMKISQDWKNDRDYQIGLLVGSSQRNGLQALDRFNGSEVLIFRVLPEQPSFDDQAPEEFGAKVPAFGVAMIERLEKKSCQGVKGWEKMPASELLTRLQEKAKKVKPTLQDLVDIANYAFFIWHNQQTALGKVKAV